MFSSDFKKQHSGHFISVYHTCSQCKKKFRCKLDKGRCNCDWQISRKDTLYYFCNKVCHDSGYISEDGEDEWQFYSNSPDDDCSSDESEDEKKINISLSESDESSTSESSSSESSSDDDDFAETSDKESYSESEDEKQKD